MFNFKRIVSIVLVSAMCIALSSCGGEKDGGKQKVSFWTHYTNMKDLQTELINEFNAKNSDIEIVVNMIADKYGDVLNMAMSSGEAPDIFTITGPSLTNKAASLGWAEPLDDFMTTEYKSLYNEDVFVNNNNVINGKTYTLPDQVSTYRMIYNKDLFAKAGLDPEKPPATFAEFREYAKKITENVEGAKGIVLALGDAYQLDVTMFNGMGNYSLGTLLGYDYAKGAFDYTAYKPAIELFRNIKKDGSMLEGELLLKPDQARSKFFDGSIGIMGSASWETSVMAESDLKFEVGITNWPTVDGAPRGKNSVQLGSGFAMCAKAKDKEATWKVLQFLASPEFTGKVNEAAGTISVYKDDSNDTVYANKYVKGFVPGSGDAIWPAVVPALKLQGDNRAAVVTRLITDLNSDIDKELDDLNKRTNDAFTKAIENNEFNKDSYIIQGFNPLEL